MVVTCNHVSDHKIHVGGQYGHCPLSHNYQLIKFIHYNDIASQIVTFVSTFVYIVS